MAWLLRCRQLTQIIVLPPSWSALAAPQPGQDRLAPPLRAVAAGRPARAVRSPRVGLPSGVLLRSQPGGVGADQNGGVPVAVGAVDAESERARRPASPRDPEQPMPPDRLLTLRFGGMPSAFIRSVATA